MIRMLKREGTLYVSFPIGRRNEVHFNAHRVFHPMTILDWAEEGKALRLERFDYVDDLGSLHQDVDLRSAVPDVSYGCGIYTFQKLR